MFKLIFGVLSVIVGLIAATVISMSLSHHVISYFHISDIIIETLATIVFLKNSQTNG